MPIATKGPDYSYDCPICGTPPDTHLHSWEKWRWMKGHIRSEHSTQGGSTNGNSHDNEQRRQHDDERHQQEQLKVEQQQREQENHISFCYGRTQQWLEDYARRSGVSEPHLISGVAELLRGAAMRLPVRTMDHLPTMWGTTRRRENPAERSLEMADGAYRDRAPSIRVKKARRVKWDYSRVVDYVRQHPGASRRDVVHEIEDMFHVTNSAAHNGLVRLKQRGYVRDVGGRLWVAGAQPTSPSRATEHGGGRQAWAEAVKEAVRENPGSTRSEIAHAAGKKRGLNYTGAYGPLNRLIEQGVIKGDEDSNDLHLA